LVRIEEDVDLEDLKFELDEVGLVGLLSLDHAPTRRMLAPVFISLGWLL
jgi:hypothetical protein